MPLTKFPYPYKSYNIPQLGGVEDGDTGYPGYLDWLTGQRGWAEFMPQLIGQVMGGIGEQEQQSFGRLKELMGYSTGQLGGALGETMGRKGVPFAPGWQSAANRFMAPMQTQMQNWMGTQQMPWSQKLGVALQTAQDVYPMFEPHLGTDYWKTLMNSFMKQLFGGK